MAKNRRIGLVGFGAMWVLALVLIGVVSGAGGALAQTTPIYGCGAGYDAPRTGATVTELRAVSFSSPRDGWAVGSYYGPGASPSNLYAIRWDGFGWTQYPMLNPGMRGNLLFGVASISANDTWAVGAYFTGTAPTEQTLTLTMHWDGRTWQHVPIPGLGNLGKLEGVSGVTSNDVWAVGSFYNPEMRLDQAIILHWDGREWTPARLPTLPAGASYLYAVSARTPNDVWAVGIAEGGSKPLLLHWDGTAWSQTPTTSLKRSPRLRGVVALGPSDAWVVGGSEAGPLALRWDGAQWRETTVLGAEGYPNVLNGVAAFSTGEAWAVGNTATMTRPSGIESLLVMRWDGRAWQPVPTGVGRFSTGFGIALAPGDNKVWIAGSYSPGPSGTAPLLRNINNTPCVPPSPQPPPTIPPPIPTSRPNIPLPPPVPLPGRGSAFFPETGQTVSGIFLEYWRSHGALPQQGYPISPLIGEVSELDGKLYTMQYFERAVFEYHPENQPPHNLLLSQLGTFAYKKKYPQGAPGQKPNFDAASIFFPLTGKRTGGAFNYYWGRNGGLAQQGYPLSNEFVETSDLDRKPYTVQYFERAVFEYHPENPPTFDVLLSQLGRFRWNEKYESFSPQPPVTPYPISTGVPTAVPGLASRLVATDVAERVVSTDNYLFWHTSNPNGPVYSYDLTQNRSFVVTARAVYKTSVISNGRIVAWAECPASCNVIRGYDLVARSELTLVQGTTRQELSPIALAGNTLYYDKYERGEAPQQGMYALDQATGQEVRLGDAVGGGSIVRDGLLLWTRTRNVTPSGPQETTLYLRRLDGGASGGELVVAAGTGGLLYDTSGDNVVWAFTAPNADQRLYLYNPRNGNRKVISQQAALSPVINRNVLVWAEARPTGSQQTPFLWSLKGYNVDTGRMWTVVPESGIRVAAKAVIGQADVAYIAVDPQVVVAELRIASLQQPR